jgi:hypothetical protein
MLTCRGRWNATAGVRNAITTPAIVGDTPEASSATQAAAPNATYTTTALTPIRQKSAYVTKMASALTSAAASIRSE